MALFTIPCPSASLRSHPVLGRYFQEQNDWEN